VHLLQVLPPNAPHCAPLRVITRNQDLRNRRISGDCQATGSGRFIGLMGAARNCDVPGGIRPPDRAWAIAKSWACARIALDYASFRLISRSWRWLKPA